MIISWFKSLSLPWKFVVIISVVGYLGYQVMSIRYEYIRHQWLKQITEEKAIIEEKKETNSVKQDSLIDSGTQDNKKIQSQIKKINSKSKRDAEAIDNTVYSNSKLDSLLASYD